MNNEIIIGTRGSDLALWQANHVKSRLEEKGVRCRLHIIKTQGDQVQHLSLDKLEGKGFFTKEIEDALLKKEIDLAVHSHKDLETEQPDGLIIAAVSDRADASELLLIRKESVDIGQPLHFKHGAVFGTSSARRKAQILHHRPDIELKDIRGNVPTRIQKLRDGHFDAILLAKAGTDRLQLDLSDLHVEVLSPYEFIPAPAQGVLAIQCRATDTALITTLQQLDHTATRERIHIERSVLNRMQGGCHLPLGIFVEKPDDQFTAHVAMARTWDAPLNRFVLHGKDSGALIEEILKKLLS